MRYGVKPNALYCFVFTSKAKLTASILPAIALGFGTDFNIKLIDVMEIHFLHLILGLDEYKIRYLCCLLLYILLFFNLSLPLKCSFKGNQPGLFQQIKIKIRLDFTDNLYRV